MSFCVYCIIALQSSIGANIHIHVFECDLAGFFLRFNHERHCGLILFWIRGLPLQNLVKIAILDLLASLNLEESLTTLSLRCCILGQLVIPICFPLIIPHLDDVIVFDNFCTWVKGDRFSSACRLVRGRKIICHIFVCKI